MFKQFVFPSFTDWVQNGSETLRIGDYYAAIICESEYQNAKTYSCYLSTPYIPFNKYAQKIFSMSVRFTKDKYNIQLLEEWYNTAIQCLNEAFIDHLNKNYCEGYIASDGVKIFDYPYRSGLCDNCINCRRDFCEIYKKETHKVFLCKKFQKDYDV